MTLLYKRGSYHVRAINAWKLQKGKVKSLTIFNVVLIKSDRLVLKVNVELLNIMIICELTKRIKQ